MFGFGNKKKTIANTSNISTTLGADNGGIVDSRVFSGTGIEILDGGAIDQSFELGRLALESNGQLFNTVEMNRHEELGNYADDLFDVSTTVTEKALAEVNSAYRSATGKTDNQWLMPGLMVLAGILFLKVVVK